MAKASASFYSLLFISSILFTSLCHAFEAQAKPPVVKGLSFSFYSKTCPKLETIVRNHLNNVFKQDNGQAPGLLRIFFHDCFVQGCDGSVLLDGSPGEREQPANIGIRPEALQTIDDIRAVIHNQCGRIVSCADITVLAARDAVFLSGGPDFAVPLGRRDGITFSTTGTRNLPSPINNTTATLDAFTSKNFDATDVVALSGAHTFGRAHCGTFFNRLSPIDPNMDKTLAKKLKDTCPDAKSNHTANLDIRTPFKFDNKYYLDLMNRQGVFTSDQDLFNDKRTKGLVNSFALDQNLFFTKFVDAVIRLSQLDVLTGNQGEIRARCNVINNKKSILESMVQEVVQLARVVKVSQPGSPGLAHHGLGVKRVEPGWLTFLVSQEYLNPARPTRVGGLNGLAHLF